MADENIEILDFVLDHQQGYEPYFLCCVGEKTIYFTPCYTYDEGRKLVESLHISTSIFECSPDEIKQIQNTYLANFPLARAYYDLVVNNLRFNYPLPLLKTLLKIERLTDEERNEIQTFIDEFTYIYLIKDSQTGFTKIGRSDNPFIRLKTLIRQDTLMPMPNDFSLSCYWQDYPAKERELHREYEDKRVRGEWFNLTEDDIKKLVAYYRDRPNFTCTLQFTFDNE